MLAQATNSICVNEILARENVFETYEIDKTPIGWFGAFPLIIPFLRFIASLLIVKKQNIE